MRPSPIEARVNAARLAFVDDADEVDDSLSGGSARRDRGKLRSRIADDDDLRVLEHRIDALDEQAGDVGDSMKYVVTVRSVDLGHVDVAVVDPDVETLADESLGELDHRALAEIVGAGFEADAEDSDLAIPRVD